MSDMTACLNDLSYIPLNNEQNEPTQGDIGKTSNDPTQAKRNEFEELYASANEELYPDCDYVTRLDFMAKFTYFKVKGKLTDSIFNEMLEFFQNVFPTAKGYKLPPSYYAIKKTFKTIRLGYESIHACVNDCFLFRGEANKDVHLCSVCNTSRWKDSNTPGKKVHKNYTKPGKMQQPVDGRGWKDFDTKYLDFTAEPRNVRLGLAADGFNPFGNLSQSYSMWPDIDVYLRPLIDDLKDLWAKPGVETIDVATGLKFNMRAMVLWTINDFPARSSLSGWSGQGYKACPTCNEDTPSVRVLGKTAYVGHRRFLKKPHKWRRSLEFNGETENGDPPREFSRDAIMTQLARLPTRVKGKHPRFRGVKIKRNVLVELNWTKRSIFYELEYWSFLTLEPNLDVMHIEKNVLEKDRKKFCQFIKGVKLPDGFGSNFKHKVTDNDTNITGLNSHDCHIMIQRLLLYGLQQYLPPDIAKPLIELCLFFKQICSQTLMVDDMLKAQRKVICILCNLELIYPPTFFDIMIHLVIHLPLEAIFGGPIRPQWMYPFERYMKKLKNYVQNKVKPKGSTAEGYVAEEALTFSSHYFRDVTMKFNHPVRNVDCPPPTCQFQVFKSLYKSIGLRSVIRIDHQELKKVIWYVLHNNPEIDTYRAKFKSEFPNKEMKEEFPGWFGKPIPHDLVDSDDEDLVNLDIDDGVNVMSADVARGHDDDGGGDDRPPSTSYPRLWGVVWQPSKGTRKPNLGGRRAGRLHTRQETRNLGLKAITDKKWAPSIWFEFGDRRPCAPGDLRSLGNSLGEAHTLLGAKKAALKERYWILDSDGTYDLERIRRAHPSHISEVDWDAQIAVLNDPKNLARAAQNKLNRAKSKVMESSTTREYPSLIHTFFLTHTIGGVFLNTEDKALYMVRLQGLGSNTETGVPYTEDEIMSIFRGGKQRGHIPGVGKVLSGQGMVIPHPPPCTHSSDVAKLKKRKKVLTKQVNMFIKLFRSDDKFSQMLTQLESQPEIGGGSGSGGCGDDES
ncbi:zinc finger, PHD-type containing protein [Tanacetum coccineum]